MAASRKDRNSLTGPRRGFVCARDGFSIVTSPCADRTSIPEGGVSSTRAARYFKAERRRPRSSASWRSGVPDVTAKVREFAYLGFGITLNLGQHIRPLSVATRGRVLLVLDPCSSQLLAVVFLLNRACGAGGMGTQPRLMRSSCPRGVMAARLRSSGAVLDAAWRT